MKTYWAHPSAIIERGAQIGAGTKIWHFCHVMKGARIGNNCVLGQNVFVGAQASIGDGCRIQNNVSVYDGVVLEDHVFVGPSAVFTNVRTPRAFVDRRAVLDRTLIGQGATIGANATIVCGIRIGEFALVGAGAVVTRPVLPHSLVTGVPARKVGYVCKCGEKISRRRGGRTRSCDACSSSGAAPRGSGRFEVRIARR